MRQIGLACRERIDIICLDEPLHLLRLSGIVLES